MKVKLCNPVQSEQGDGDSLLRLRMKGALGIRRIFYLVDTIINTEFSGCHYGFKIGMAAQKNMHNKHRNTFQSASAFKKSRKNLRFLHLPLILRLYIVCRLDQTFSKCITCFPKNKCAKMLRMAVLFIS